MPRKNSTTAVAYYRTSSAGNVGADKDSEKRQREAVQSYAGWLPEPTRGHHPGDWCLPLDKSQIALRPCSAQ
jgi:hypothetical protein